MIFKLIIIIIIYVSILKFFSPIIDHEFGELDKSKSNIIMRYRIVFQAIAIIVFITILSKCVNQVLELKQLNIFQHLLQ